METNLELEDDDHGCPANRERAEWALEAMKAFVEITGQHQPQFKEEDREIVGDLIANLGHYCKQSRLDFFDVIRGALCTFAEEHLEEELGLGPLGARFEAEIIVRQIG